MSLIIDEICLVIIIIEKKNATLASIKRLIHYSNCTYRQSFVCIFIMPFGIIAEIDRVKFLNHFLGNLKHRHVKRA